VVVSVVDFNVTALNIGTVELRARIHLDFGRFAANARITNVDLRQRIYDLRLRSTLARLRNVSFEIEPSTAWLPGQPMSLANVMRQRSPYRPRFPTIAK
jgi:hypothetical protein